MGTPRKRRIAAVVLASLLALAAMGGAADAKKKKKKPIKIPATTASQVVGMLSSTSPATTASCTGKTHATGGGYAVAPSFTPPAIGLRSLNSTSYPSGDKGWTAGGSAYATPPAAGQITAYARCENNALRGRIVVRGSSTLTLVPGQGQNMIFNCPAGTHVISGGYSATSLGAFTFNLASHRVVVLQSRRTGPGQWTISAFNNPASPAPANLTGYSVCEANGKGQTVTESASPVTTIVNDSRTAADATCGGKVHTVSGGFLVLPSTFPGTVPLVSVDENQPIGKAGWHVGLWEYPTALPPGSSLQTFAYCKRG